MSSSSYRVIIIGAGPGGLCMGAKLRQAGYNDFVIVERAAGVGGTWRWNSYPGAACDLPSHLYSFSFALNPEWTRPYARQPEILAYLEQFARDQELEPHLRLGVEVAGAQWHAETTQWHVQTSAGKLVADVLVSAVGMFGDVNWPDIPGLDSFAGEIVHAARWQQDRSVAGRSVAVIGSGATAIQLVPQVAPATRRFYHFQRQPQWVGPKTDDVPYTAEQLELFRSDPQALQQHRQVIFDRVDSLITFSNPEALKAAEEAGLRNLARVEDPVTRERLTPRNPYGCHRPLNSEIYYPTFNLPHVEAVTDPIRAVTAGAIVTADGVAREVDTIILTTGFATTKFLTVIKVVGRDGLLLDDAWADGPQAYLGVSTPGFPNLFMIYGPNVNNGSILHMIEIQAIHVVQQLDRMTSENLRTLEVRPDITHAYNAQLQDDIRAVKVWQSDCHGYYRVPSGRVVTQWPHTMAAFTETVGTAAGDAYHAR